MPTKTVVVSSWGCTTYSQYALIVRFHSPKLQVLPLVAADKAFCTQST
jgi:hypothetical protein